MSSTTMDQISAAAISADGASLTFTDGSSLNVAGSVGATFKLADGSTYLADQTSGQWIRNS